MITRSVRLLVLLGLIAPLQSTLSNPREVVTEIASLIENNYFDAQTGREVARELRMAVRSGAYGKYAEPRDLAAALTAQLRRTDQHFNVVWFPAPQVGQSSASEVESFTRALSGRSYGVRSVSMLSGSVGYIDMRSLPYISFRRADDPARLAADAALQLISGASAVIFDLRHAIGGYPEMAGYLVSAFVEPDAEIYNVFHSRDGQQSERPVQTYHSPMPDIPVYVLVSGSTASAAESVAYTLQAAKRAVIVGEPTRGAANPGGMLPVGHGFNVFISNATPINPITGTNWEGEGVQPDIAVPSEQAVQRAHIEALEHMLKQSGGSAATDIRWTLEALTIARTPPARVALSAYAGKYSGASVSIRGDGLHLLRDRGPVMRLLYLRDDTFVIEDEPSRRVMFERDAAGAITGFQLVRSNGYSIWHPRR
jgi:hypothetical protein